MAYEYRHIFDFQGGMNDSSSPDNLATNEMLWAENVELSNRGGFSRRKGIDLWREIETEAPVDRLLEFEVYDSGTRTRKILALSDGKLIDTDDNSVLKTGLDAHLDYVVYKNNAYILSNGKYMIYDGNTVEDITCDEEDSNLERISKCKYIAQRSERFFFAGNPDDPNALYFSELGRPEYAKVVSVVQAISADADMITGLSNYHGAMLVFKSKRVYAWFGYDPKVDVEFQELDVHTGTRSHRTIVKVENYLFFLGEDGVYALIGTYKDVISTVKISTTINEKIKQIQHAEDPYLDLSCAVYHDNKYMLSIPTIKVVEELHGQEPEPEPEPEEELENRYILVLHVDFFEPKQNEPWVLYTGWNTSDFLASLNGSLYIASSETDKIYKHTNVYSDAGEPIIVNVTLKPVSMEAPIHNKKFRRGYVALRQYENLNTTLTIVARIDYKRKTHYTSPDESLAWDIRPWDASQFGTIKWDFIDLVTRRFDIKDKGKRLILEIFDDSVDQSLTVYGFGIEYKIKKPDRRS